MTSEQHLHFIQFIEERRSQASSPQTKAAYTIVKNEYMKIHKKNLEVIDMDFKLLKDIPPRLIRDGSKTMKAGEVFKSFGGLVSGVRGIDFSNKEYFEPINIKYQIND